MIYQTTNTDNQVIDTFIIPEIRSIDYTIQISTSNNFQVSYLTITHDGSTTGEVQECIVHNSIISPNAIRFTSDINEYIGRVLVTPNNANTKFIINKIAYPTDIYSENTKSGKLIFHSEGFGMDRNSPTHSITIRQENNNFYGSPNTFFVANTLGPTSTLNELNNNNWISVNGNDLEISDYYTFISSGQNPNYQVQQFQVEPNYSYKLTANAFYEIADSVVVKEMTQRQQGQCFIRIGNSPGSSEYINHELSLSEENTNLIFHPKQENVYVSVGFGDRSNKAKLKNLSIKKAVPVHTWNSNTGTFIMYWYDPIVFQSISESFEFIINEESSNVQLNGNIIGPKDITNKLAIAYTDSNIFVSLNGANTLSFNASMINTYQFMLENIDEFSYIPIALSNNELMSLSQSG